jgi:uncharacterized damage-inducible protein DinB
MNEDPLAPLRAAHGEIVALARTIQDAALDWQPDAESWSLKRTLAHVAHAYDFYLLIVEQARSTDCGTATLRPEMPGWQRVEATGAAAMEYENVPALLAVLDATYERALAVFAAITPAELDRPFALASWRPDRAPETTTLRRRVIETATEHLDEHRKHLAATLAAWEAHNQA